MGNTIFKRFLVPDQIPHRENIADLGMKTEKRALLMMKIVEAKHQKILQLRILEAMHLKKYLT